MRSKAGDQIIIFVSRFFFQFFMKSQHFESLMSRSRLSTHVSDGTCLQNTVLVLRAGISKTNGLMENISLWKN